MSFPVEPPETGMLYKIGQKSSNISFYKNFPSGMRPSDIVYTKNRVFPENAHRWVTVILIENAISSLN